MFSTIAQLIQAEAPQGFSAKAQKSATEGDAAGGAFAELLAVLQAASAQSAGAGTIADASAAADSADADGGAAEAAAAAPAGTAPEADAAADGVASEQGTAPGSTAPATPSAEAADTAPVGGAESLAAASRTEAKRPVQAAQPNGAAVETARTAAVEGAEADGVKAASTKSVKPAGLPEGVAAEVPKGSQGGATPKPAADTVIPKPVLPEEPVTAATQAQSDAEVSDAAEAAAPRVAAARSAEDAEVNETDSETDTVEEAPADEAPAPRRSLFASVSRREGGGMDVDGVHERGPDLLRTAETHRGRPAGVRAMLLMQAAPKAEAEVTAAPAKPGTPDSAATVDAVATSAASEVKAAAEAAEGPDSAPERSTLPEVAKTTLRGVRYLIGKGERTITVKLVPESLGELRLDVITKGDEIHVRIASAHPAVRDALESQMHGLRENLSRDGIDVKQIDVRADMSGNGDRGQHPSREAGSESARAFARMAQSMPSRGLAAVERPTVAYTPSDAFQRGGLNVFA